jgi:hypothetical protein
LRFFPQALEKEKPPRAGGKIYDFEELSAISYQLSAISYQLSAFLLTANC